MLIFKNGGFLRFFESREKWIPPDSDWIQTGFRADSFFLKKYFWITKNIESTKPDSLPIQTEPKVY